MKIGDVGLTLLKSSEVYIGFVYDDRDRAWPRRRLTWRNGWFYPDGSRILGTPTYGYGFVARGPDDCPENFTEAQASDMLRARVADYEAAVMRGWGANFAGKPNPTQLQFDALCDFAWNEGQGAVQKLISGLAAGDVADDGRVKALFVAWDKWTVNGKLVENAGLKMRRLKEAALFLTPPAEMPIDPASVLASVYEAASQSIAQFIDGSPLPDAPTDPTA